MKEESVFFQLPIEEMRGKLATKQTDIRYSSQLDGGTAYTVTEGKKAATNFRKYIVLYKRRGKNRFYIKSNTSVNFTVASRLQTAALGMAAIFADAMVKIPVYNSQITAAYEAYVTSTGDTISKREFIVSQIIDDIKSKRALTILDYAHEQQGLIPVLAYENPFMASFFDATTEIPPQLTQSQRLDFVKYLETLKDSAPDGWTARQVRYGATTYNLYTDFNQIQQDETMSGLQETWRFLYDYATQTVTYQGQTYENTIILTVYKPNSKIPAVRGFLLKENSLVESGLSPVTTADLQSEILESNPQIMPL